jgi:hypothetical protein
MKTNFFYFFIILLMLAFTSSCEKNNSAGNKDMIFIGDFEGLKIEYHDTIVIGGYNMKQYYFIDVENDGINDFAITSTIWGSPGLGQHPGAEILCLDPGSLINVTPYNDTTFLHIRSDIYNWDKVEIYIRKITTCERVEEDDSILSISAAHYLNVYDRNDMVSINDSWISDTFGLNRDWFSYPYTLIYDSPDTSIYEDYVFEFDCHSIPGDRIAYLGIMQENSEKKKLGWIKLSITDDYKVSVLETAIQK